MTRVPIYLIFIFSFFLNCKNPVPKVNLVGSADPDIVLVNIEDGNREFISKILLKIDSLKPILIGIDVFFISKKTPQEDSALINSLQKVYNDILIYGLGNNNPFEHSDSAFTQYVTDEGYLKYDRTLSLISNMTPLPKIENTVHESFAYKIVKHWKPDFKLDIKENQQIPINYQRTLDKYLKLDGSLLIGTNIDNFELKDKIFLVGYIGPGREDKYSTPLRFVGKELEHDEPDTYGLVIIANEIRTLLDYKK
ncbi:CHASE2 domain-containing protein [Lacibacter sediminis]|uniref:CHASE2 domain-containing protein n=1 Tax=Lacibacter sediminis TaxID=2760713 RepID=A0A7G5XB47_9BACT|nr:CHASE2 domain-containing protein [Lacibacter sediminis]QNA42700.1 CHASE2 domain-containing protein [Lacibacter sediminis]